ncbi:MAG TPA: glutaredoxin family protein [Burkholderiales bacterium]|nr:glutaredoxin family protein [Burkholderiales bacterium]
MKIVILLVLAAGAYGAWRYVESQDPLAAPAKSAPVAAAPQGRIPLGSATYGVSTPKGVTWYVTPETRKRIDQFSREQVVLFGTASCPYCAQERAALRAKGIAYAELDVESDPKAMQFMNEVLGVADAPATVFGTRFMRGWDAHEFGEIAASF